jgi:predicted nucleic acid-binding protein
VSGLLDTSIIVRYLTGEPPDQFAQASQLIELEDGLQITDAALAEAAYVLTRVYRLPREVVVDHLVALLQRRNVDSFRLDKAVVLQALLLCRPSGRVSFADAFIWAAARSTDEKVVNTLDERFPSDGIEIRRERS